MKPANKKEAQIRRQAHAKAILHGITIRQAVFEALEIWVRRSDVNTIQGTDTKS